MPSTMPITTELERNAGLMIREGGHGGRPPTPDKRTGGGGGNDNSNRPLTRASRPLREKLVRARLRSVLRWQAHRYVLLYAIVSAFLRRIMNTSRFRRLQPLYESTNGSLTAIPHPLWLNTPSADPEAQSPMEIARRSMFREA